MSGGGEGRKVRGAAKGTVLSVSTPAAKMASLVTSNANTVLQLKLHLNHVLRIINEYRWIIEAYVSVLTMLAFNKKI